MAVKTSQPSLVNSVSAVRRIVLLSSITRTFSHVSFGLPLVIMLSMKLPLRDLGHVFVGAGILWLFNISGACKPRYGVDIWRQESVNIGGVVHSFSKRADTAVAYARLQRPEQSSSPPKDRHAFSSSSGRGHGSHRSHQTGEGQHACDLAGGATPRLGTLLRPTTTPL